MIHAILMLHFHSGIYLIIRGVYVLVIFIATEKRHPLS